MLLSQITTFVSAFLASLVEAVEALTIVLAAGYTRGWRPALLGAFAALVLIIAVAAIFGPLILLLPVRIVRLALGLFLLFFGLRWLRKAVLRAAGVIPLRNETKAYSRTEDRLRVVNLPKGRFDAACFTTCFMAVFVEGLEVVFIVVSLGSAAYSLRSATWGAGLACFTVILLGWTLHRPLTRLPENGLKFAVGVLLTGFGIFWTVEGVAGRWPGGDFALIAIFLIVTTFSIASVLWRKAAR
jgi:Ca2+/H+ antiporter, TMEM165/GDT1 family